MLNFISGYSGKVKSLGKTVIILSILVLISPLVQSMELKALIGPKSNQKWKTATYRIFAAKKLDDLSEIKVFHNAFLTSIPNSQATVFDNWWHMGDDISSIVCETNANNESHVFTIPRLDYVTPDGVKIELYDGNRPKSKDVLGVWYLDSLSLIGAKPSRTQLIVRENGSLKLIPNNELRYHYNRAKQNERDNGGKCCSVARIKKEKRAKLGVETVATKCYDLEYRAIGVAFTKKAEKAIYAYISKDLEFFKREKEKERKCQLANKHFQKLAKLFSDRRIGSLTAISDAGGVFKKNYTLPREAIEEFGLPGATVSMRIEADKSMFGGGDMKIIFYYDGKSSSPITHTYAGTAETGINVSEKYRIVFKFHSDYFDAPIHVQARVSRL